MTLSTATSTATSTVTAPRCSASSSTRPTGQMAEPMAARVTEQVIERWGWHSSLRVLDGLPTWRWRCAPAGLVTRRQMRAAGLAPGGADPVGQVACRRDRRRALLWDRGELVAKRVPTPAQLQAVAAALAARRWCPGCRRDVGYCIPTSIGRCADCQSPTGPTPDPDLAGAA